MMASLTPFLPAAFIAFGLGMVVVAYEPNTNIEVNNGAYRGSHMSVCGSGVRHNCVIDGDTLWLDGEKIRLLGIDTPEMNGACSSERRQAIMARDALVKLVSDAEIKVRRNGVDRYGRTLATVYANGVVVSEELISRDLGRRWDGRRRSWC